MIIGKTYDRQGITSVPTDKGGVTPVEDAPAVTYTYDEVGRRLTMMTEGGRGGTVTYHYDSLSRMEREDRQFPGLSGTYRLSYEYLLTGQLKKITEQKVAEQTAVISASYFYDKAGRMTDVKGDGFVAGSQTTFATSMQYRAWGALKEMSYGNATGLSLNYDSRMRVTHYGVNAAKDGVGQVVTEGGDFLYHADGRVKFAKDLYTNATGSGLHDRAFIFDHAGRLKEAFSWTEAQNFKNDAVTNVTANMPFRQSYAYDAWDNLVSRIGKYWGQDDITADTFNQQERNPEWEYDPEGRLVSRDEEAPTSLNYQPLRNAYDAAGRLSQRTQVTTRSLGPNSTPRTTAVTLTDIYDGDGQGVKHSKTTQINNSAPATTTTFYLRSSVLGGRVISEYDSAGSRRNSYVWAGGELVARQTQEVTVPDGLLWRHKNPVTGDQLETNKLGTIIAKTTLDPTGVDVGDSDPFVQEVSGDPAVSDGIQASIDAMVAQLIPGWGGPKCTVDGVLMGCRTAIGVRNSGAGDIVSDPNDFGTINLPGHIWVDAWEDCTNDVPGADVCARNVGYFADDLSGDGPSLAKHVSLQPKAGCVFNINLTVTDKSLSERDVDEIKEEIERILP